MVIVRIRFWIRNCCVETSRADVLCRTDIRDVAGFGFRRVQGSALDLPSSMPKFAGRREPVRPRRH
jgi:hypothetical protein